MHGVVAVGRLEVLPDGDDRASVGEQVVHRLLDLGDRLPEPDHEARLDRHATAGEAGEDVQAGGVVGTAAHSRCDAAHGLDVVRDDVRACVGYHVEQFVAALEVGYQHLQCRGGGCRLYLPDRRHPMRRPEVGQVVAVNRGDDGVAQLHQGYRPRHVGRLGRVERHGAAALGVAELAGAGADVAAYHERGRAPPPAFADVGATPAAADGVQAVAVHNLLGLSVSLVCSEVDFEPLGLSHVLGHGVVQRFSFT